jgi:hypothetical protein
MSIPFMLLLCRCVPSASPLFPSADHERYLVVKACACVVVIAYHIVSFRHLSSLQSSESSYHGASNFVHDRTGRASSLQHDVPFLHPRFMRSKLSLTLF